MQEFAQGIRENLLFYLKHLYTMDFLFIILVLFIFITLLLGAVFLRHRAFLASFFIVFDFSLCVALGFFGYQFIDERVRQRSVEITQQKIYGGSNLAIDFTITNTSKYDFSYCRVQARLYENVDSNSSFLARYKAEYIPYRKKSKELNNALLKGNSQSERINFDNINEDLNLSIQMQSRCF